MKVVLMNMEFYVNTDILEVAKELRTTMELSEIDGILEKIVP